MIEGDNLASYRHGIRIGVVVSVEGGNADTAKHVSDASCGIQPNRR